MYNVMGYSVILISETFYSMHLPRYDYERRINPREYEFFSEGPKGRIHKVVQFQYMISPLLPFFNLCFGDWNELALQIDDTAITNNGDAEKVLTTVCAITIEFMHKHKDAMIIARGSNIARTRRYQIGINKFLDEIEDLFNIYGRKGGKWKEFRKNINYDAFIISEKELLILEEPNEPYMSKKSSNKKTQPSVNGSRPKSTLDSVDLDKDPFFLRKKEDVLRMLEESPIPPEFFPKSWGRN